MNLCAATGQPDSIIRVFVLASAAIMTASTLACSAEPSTPREDSAKPVTIAGEPVWAETSVVEELRIGVESGPQELMFGSVNRITVGADGAIFVADYQARVIRMFDDRGAFVRNIGTEGQGPGEYSRAWDMKVMPDGRLAVWDLQNARITLFDNNGRLSQTIAVPRGRGGNGKVLRYDRDGNFYVRTVATGFGLYEQRALIKLSPDGAEIDEIPLPDSRPLVGGTGFLNRDPSGELIAPFTVEYCWAWSPEGYLVVARNDEYGLELRKPGGTIGVRRNLPRVSLGGEELAQWQAQADLVDTQTRAPDLPEIFPVPETKPLIRDIYAGEDGRIWVHRYVEAEERDPPPATSSRPRVALRWYEPPTFDVFEPDTTFLGTVVLPFGVRPLHWSGDQLWGTDLGDDGTTFVVRLRVLHPD